MSKQTQRVQDLVNGGYIREWKKGHSPAEIANIFHISPQTVYNNLQIIADKNGLTRKELLVAPNRSGPKSSSSCPLRKEAVDAHELLENFKTLEASITTIIKEINTMIEEI